MGVFSVKERGFSMMYLGRLGLLVLLSGFLGVVAGKQTPVSAATVMTISHSNSLEFSGISSIACISGDGGSTLANSYWRVFDLPAFGIQGDFTVTSVDFGIQVLQPAAIPITVNLYSLEGSFLLENLTTIGSATEEVQPTESTIHTMEVTGVAPASSSLVVEVAVPALDQGGFYIGANDLGQTGPSYLSAPACNVEQPTSMAELNFPDVHIIMQVTGSAAPFVSDVEVSASPSDEGAPVTASTTFSPAAMVDPVCTVDYGDGSGPLAGTVEGDSCTGPEHVYADDQPGGYDITIKVCDGVDCDQSSVNHMVDNVPPEITGIEASDTGGVATIIVSAIDPGVADVLTYAFDCDADGLYETPGNGNQGQCQVDPTVASTSIGVQVSDGDGGVTTGSVEVHQALALCGSRYTGALSGMPASGACPAGHAPLSLPGPNPVMLCVNAYTGALTWSPRGACGAGFRAHVVPDSGPLSYCQSLFTGQLRYSANGSCSAYERPGAIPG